MLLSVVGSVLVRVLVCTEPSCGLIIVMSWLLVSWSWMVVRALVTVAGRRVKLLYVISFVVLISGLSWWCMLWNDLRVCMVEVGLMLMVVIVVIVVIVPTVPRWFGRLYLILLTGVLL